MFHEIKECRYLINQQLAKAVEKNPKYSLRQFAKKLGLSPSFLSKFLNGKKEISAETAVRVLRELDIDLTPLSKKTKKPELLIDHEVFKYLATWYHLPLLEFMKTLQFVPDPKWIGRRMSLPPEVISAAIDRLKKLGYVSEIGGSLRVEEQRHLRTTDDVADIAIRKHHLQVLDRAKDAVHDDVKLREFQALNIPFDRKTLAKAKKRIRDFVANFNSEFSDVTGNDVYQLNIQFFNLTGGEK